MWTQTLLALRISYSKLGSCFHMKKGNIKYLGQAKSCQDLKLNHKLSKQFNRDSRLEKKWLLYFSSLRDRRKNGEGKGGKQEKRGEGGREEKEKEYHERLGILKLNGRLRLSYERSLSALVQIYKIIFGHCSIDPHMFF